MPRTKGCRSEVAVMRSKYGSRKTVVDGISFDSKKEASRYRELLLLERAGKIRNLRRQVKYVLIPAQYENPDSPTKSGRGKCLERECSYVADFVYDVPMEPELVEIVEDTKGFRTEAYKIKRKMMLFMHGIRIREV